MTDKRYEIAYESAKSALELQQTSLNNIRNRTVSLLAAAALFISFAAALGVLNTDPNRGKTTPLWITITLLAVLLLVLILVIEVLRPAPWTRGLTGRHIIASIEEGTEESALLQQLAEAIDDKVVANQSSMARKSRASLAIVALVTVAALLLILTTALA